ncbi:MAG: NAD(P)H-hydrate dehydratase [Desulfococcaceae bacterium]|jgi:NAD(P)H-hydrate epimerase|nr:NAD(P)H-hydrate dehydratase [Desulfococcaceae bacterium]
MKVFTVSEMRKADQYAIETLGIPEEILMENAGLAACRVLSGHMGIPDKSFLIFCGAGNNGGDGLVMARKLHSLGGRVKVYFFTAPEKYKGAAKINYDIVCRLGIGREVIGTADSLSSEMQDCAGIIDAIFGTGLSRNVEGKYKDVIESINDFRKKGKTVLSLDIPSGVNGDNGQVMGTAVQADYTVTFGGPKTGSLLYPGYALAGKLFVTHISFPPSLHQSDDLQIAVSLPPKLPRRDPDGYKGGFGDALFIGGAAGYYGAPCFSALAFLKSGGGYSRLAAPASLIPVIAARAGELVFVPLAETASGSISLQNKASLLDISRKTDITVLGPGFSTDEESQELARQLAAEIEGPLLIDGDGITALSKNPGILRRRKGATVLTPHMGEMVRISRIPMDEIRKKRMEVLQKTAAALNAFIVLKGPHSQTACPDGRIFISMSGNSGMATAGSGDVLCGTIAAMYGLGLSMEDAVKKGVFIHGLAGDLAAEKLGEDGMIAGDILNYLPFAVKTDRQGISEKYRLPLSSGGLDFW